MIAFEDLKAAIRESDMSAFELAKRADVVPITLYKWLDGRTHTPHLDTAVRVAAVLGKRFELLNGAVRLTPTPSVNRQPERFTHRLPMQLRTWGAWRR